MATLLNQGYLKIWNTSNTILVYCKGIKWSKRMRLAAEEHFPGPTHSVVYLDETWMEFTITNMFTDSHSNYTTIVSNLNTWQSAGTFKLAIMRDASNYIQCDGTNTSYTVNLREGIIDTVPESVQEGVYIIGRTVLVQSG